jgi:hypothetical protein
MITTYFTPEQIDIYGDYLLSRRFMKGHMGRSEWDDIAARYPITLDEWFSSGVPALQELKAQMSSFQSRRPCMLDSPNHDKTHAGHWLPQS